MGVAIFTTFGPLTWDWPPGVTRVTAEAISGGAGGGYVQGLSSTGGGGVGGGYARATITKGEETFLEIEVGHGGGPTAQGEPSFVKQGGIVRLRATYGAGATTISANFTNGAGATSIFGTPLGSVTFDGGSGGTGDFTPGVAGSGGGGGAAGPRGSGRAAEGHLAGRKGPGTFRNGVAYSGMGAAGAGDAQDGLDGQLYGGAASGGKTIDAIDKQGGNGAQGIVVLTWGRVRELFTTGGTVGPLSWIEMIVKTDT